MTVSFALVTFGIGIGGLGGAIALGTGIGILGGMSGSIIAQGDFSNANPFKVLSAGLIGGIIGAVTSIVSFGFAQIGQAIGQSIGTAINGMIITGIKVAKVFGMLVPALFKISGYVIGSVVGGAIMNHFANLIFEKKSTAKENTKEGITGNILGWLGDIFRWLR